MIDRKLVASFAVAVGLGFAGNAMAQSGSMSGGTAPSGASSSDTTTMTPPPKTSAKTKAMKPKRTSPGSNPATEETPQATKGRPPYAQGGAQ